MFSAQGPSSKWKSYSVMLDCKEVTVVTSIEVGAGYRNNNPIYINYL